VRGAGAANASGMVQPVRRSHARRRRTGAGSDLFVEFEHERWYSTGHPRTLDPASLKKVGELNGFPVFTARNSNGATIYIPIAKDADAYASYAKRKKQ